MLLLLPHLFLSGSPEELPSICVRNCSGHGSCANWMCECFVGYHGEDCSYTFSASADQIVPILTAGDFNLTKKNMTKSLKKHTVLLVGFSARSCHKCVRVESEYAAALPLLGKLEKRVPFGRIDAAKCRKLAQRYGATALLPFTPKHGADPGACPKQSPFTGFRAL